MNLTATIINDEPVEFLFNGVTIPAVVGWNVDNTYQTAHDLAQRKHRRSETCNHKGATWSSNPAMYCPKCGARMFLPRQLLAYLPASQITAMNILWNAAGRPEWHGLKWRVNIKYWTLMQHPLFDHCDGIPVRHDRTKKYYDALLAIAEDDQP